MQLINVHNLFIAYYKFMCKKYKHYILLTVFHVHFCLNQFCDVKMREFFECVSGDDLGWFPEF